MDDIVGSNHHDYWDCAQQYFNCASKCSWRSKSKSHKSYRQELRKVRTRARGEHITLSIYENAKDADVFERYLIRARGAVATRKTTLHIFTFILIYWTHCLASDEVQSLADVDAHNQDDYSPILSFDSIEDSFLDPLSPDPSCSQDDCFSPPRSTVDQEQIEVAMPTNKLDASCFKGRDDVVEEECYVESFELAVTNPSDTCIRRKEVTQHTTTIRVDKHWGSDPDILNMRDQLLNQSLDSLNDSRPPIFLLPGLASTRLVAWKAKNCTAAFLKEIKVQENVWLNMNLVLRMGTMDVDCMKQCLELGRNQSDTDDWNNGCKLRPGEGLDSISSLSPAGIGAELLVGGTNTVYAWLIQWLSDHLGYDVTNIVGLPYDWRLSPDKMEARDGFLNSLRRRIEAAVVAQGKPGIMVAHSMGNLVFRYFLEWLRFEMRQERYFEIVKRQRRRVESWKRQHIQEFLPDRTEESEQIQDRVASPQGKRYGAGKESTLWELAKQEGDNKFFDWLETHVWTLIGLSPPLLGAVNPLRAVLSGENMGLPMQDSVARDMELTFGSTHTLNPVSSTNGFCDERTSDEWGEDVSHTSTLACLDDIMHDIEVHSSFEAWKDFPALRSLMRDRVDWNTGKPMIGIELEKCHSQDGDEKRRKPVCRVSETIHFGPKSVEDASIFDVFNRYWQEEDEPLIVKKKQLVDSFMNSSILNILNNTWERPLIKHIIMAYGVDVPTEVGYIYSKDEETNSTGIPRLAKIIWENPRGELSVESFNVPRGGIADVLLKKKSKHTKLNFTVPYAQLHHSGDGSVPYLSLSWSHTWLLHAARARRKEGKTANTTKQSALDHIMISHRPRGELKWVNGPPPNVEQTDDRSGAKMDETGTTHPHGTRYKPLMKKFHNIGISRTTGIEYTTSIIEAIGVEHKETTRNYDILAAVFTDVVKYMHEDLGLV